jgi:hypothetical protein
LRLLATYLDSWKCRSKTATGCLSDLGEELLERGILSDSNMEVIGMDVRFHVFKLAGFKFFVINVIG